MRMLYQSLSALLLVVGVTGPAVRAQQQQTQQPQQQQQQTQQQGQQPSSPQSPDQPTQPIPAYRSPLGVGSDVDAEGDPQKMEPDTHSLAGVQDLSVGVLRTSRNYWAPYVELSSTLDSAALSTSSGAGWSTWTSFYGGIDLDRTSGNSSFNLTYMGGGAISNDSGISNSVVQQLGLVESVTFRRYQVTFLDQLAYLPESSFGYAGLGGAGLLSGGSLGLQSSFEPNQSILTPFGQRISNSFITQVNAFVTPRSSLTFSGSYGNLHFFDNDLNNTNDVVVQAGYNYLLSRKDTIAVMYHFGAFRYDHIAQSIDDHSVQVSYARRITGRLAFQASAGPDVTFSQTPISPTSTTPTSPTPGTTTGKTRQFFWDLSTNLEYDLRRTSLRATYGHGVTGGSGVLAGAVTDNLSGTASRQLTRNLRGSWMLGYSRNTGVAILPGISTITPGQTYDYWFTGLNFSRNLGRYMNLYASYQLNYQNANIDFCVTSSCGTSFIQHEITFSLGWRARPMSF